MPRTQILKDVRGLRDHQPAGLEERRRKRREFFALTLHQRDHPVLAVAAPRHVDIRRARLFQRQPDILPATLDLRPIKQLVAHGCRLHV
jgi:hypothetical protein